MSYKIEKEKKSHASQKDVVEVNYMQTQLKFFKIKLEGRKNKIMAVVHKFHQHYTPWHILLIKTPPSTLNLKTIK